MSPGLTANSRFHSVFFWVLFQTDSDLLPAVQDVTAVVRGQMLRSARRGRETHSRQGLTDSLMWSISKPAELLNHEG